MKAAIILLLTGAFLMGCGGDPARLSVSPEPSDVTIPVSVRSAVLAEITLPEYANAPEIVVETPEGLIETLPGVIWADVPEDAMANLLVRNLSQITTARVARAPWPLSDFPDAELTVRVDRMLLRADGRFWLSGQFAIRRDAGPWAERLRTFDISAPVAEVTLPNIARAQAQVWRQLAEDIARQM